MTYIATGSVSAAIGESELFDMVARSLSASGTIHKAIALPPDGTRRHSQAGPITDIVYRILGSALAAVMPALGSHEAMSGAELASMFPGTPKELFRVHDWRNGVATLDRIAGSRLEELSEGLVSYDWPVQASKELVEGGYDRIISIGQVVPHEVVGMANHAKNIFVGVGGKEAIDGSHFLGAMYGMERMMGRTDTPVRALFDGALERAQGRIPPVLWMLTVVGRKADGGLAIRGFFSGDDRECFVKAAELAREVNLDLVEKPLRRTVVWLDPEEYRTTWLGNKAVYRTRMAMADGGELIILAPGLERFGEDHGIDALIRKYGYRPRQEMATLAREREDLAMNRSAAAHLVHGSPEGRFKVVYAPGPKVSKAEIESVNFGFMDLGEALARFRPESCVPGANLDRDGAPFFFVPNPGLGLWSLRSRFQA